MKLSAQKIKSTFNKGFTLIELLVVIGILGVLAAALVATIDPFEQIQKANDSKIKNMAVEFMNANVRYYTTQGSFPWDDDDSTHTDCTGLGAAIITGVALGDASGDMEDCIDALSETGELKTSFTSNANDLDNVLVSWDPNDPTRVVVCFAPVSKSQKASPETIYTTDDGSTTDPNTCPDANAADGTCYWCTE